MPVSGLVATVRDAADLEPARDALASHPCVTVGPIEAHRIAFVVDTSDKASDKKCWADLNAIEHINHIDVVFIGFDDDASFHKQPHRVVEAM